MPSLADLYPELYGSPEQNLQQNKPGLATSFKGALYGYPAGLGRGLEDAALEVIGTPIRKFGEEGQQRNPSSPASQSFEGFFESPWQGTKEIVGQGLGYTLPAILPYVGPAGRALGPTGATVAGAGLSAVPSYGQIRATQDQMGISDPGSALLGAAATGAIEQIGGVQGLLRPGMQGTLGSMPRHLLGDLRSTPLRTGLYTANRVGLGEAAEELAQNPIEQYAGGQDPWEADRIHETLFGGFSGYVGGVVPFGAGAGIHRSMQHAGAQQFVDQTLGNQNAGMNLQMEALELQQHLTPNQQLYAQQLAALNEQVYQGMLRGEQVNMLQPMDIDALERIGADNDQLFNQTINPYDVGGQVSALQQGQETDPFEQQLGLFGGGGAQPFTPPLSAPGGFAPLPTGQPMQAFPHQGQAMPQGQGVEQDVSRAASIMAQAVQGANVLPTDREWAHQVLQRELTPKQYEGFIASVQEGAKRKSAPAGAQQKQQSQQQQKAQPAPAASPYEQLYKESGGIYSPAQKALAAAKTDEEALGVVRDVLENKKPSQKVMQALEEVHKKLSGQTMTQYLRAKETQEKQDPKKPGPVTITKGDANAQANVPVQNVRQEASAGQVPGQTQVGGADAVRQTPLPGPATSKQAGAGSVSQVQTKARPEDQGARPEADRKQGQAQQVGWQNKEPEEVQQFVLERVADKVGVKKALIAQLTVGWGQERSLTFSEIADRMKITRQRAQQIWKELSRSGGAIDQVMSEHGIEQKHIQSKEVVKDAPRPEETLGDRPEPNIPSSLGQRAQDAAAAGIVDPDAEAGTVDRNTGFSTGDISKVNSSNITGQLSTSIDQETDEAAVGKEFTPDQEGKANERAAAFEQAQAEEDIEGQAILAWNTGVEFYGLQGEKIKPWDKIAPETKKAFIEKFTASLGEAKDNLRAAKQLGAFRRLVKQVYYSYGNSFEEKDLRHDGVQRALNELWDSGLYHILNFGAVRITDDERMGTADGRAVLRDDGTFTIILNAKMFAGVKSDKHISHVLRHELSHAIDAVGLYSSSGKFDVVMDEARKLYWESDHLSVWKGYLAYPFEFFKKFANVKYRELGGIEAFKAEVFAQMHAMWMVPAGRDMIQRDAPLTADFLRKVQEHAKRTLQETIDQGAQGVPGAATGRGVAYSDPRAQPRAGSTRVFDHKAFHGTPHEVDQFTVQKIGTGEGAQAFGWGLYFASNKEVAKWYRENLAERKDADPARTLVQSMAQQLGTSNPTLVAEEIRKRIEAGLGKDFGQIYAPILDEVSTPAGVTKTQRRPRHPQPTGRLYEVELSPQLDEYLDSDKPFDQQSKKVQAALERVFVKHGLEFRDFWDSRPGIKRSDPNIGPGSRGAHIYRELADVLGRNNVDDMGRVRGGNFEGASKALLAAGIPGIKYLQGASRDKGEGDYNFVIFDDSLVKITAAESRGKSFEEAGLPEREAFRPQLHEGFAKAVEEVAAAVKSGDRVRERNARSKTIPIGRTPVVLRAITTITGEKVFRKSDFVIGNGSTIYLKGQDEHQASAHGWAVPVETLKQLPQLLADPVAVFRSGERSSDSDSYKVVLDAEVAGKPVIAAIKPNRPQQEFGGETAHFTVTVFPLRNGWTQVEQWNDLGLLRYYDDKRAPAVQPGTSPQGLTGARGTKPDFSVGVAKAPVKVVTKSAIEATPRELYSMGTSFEESAAYPAELKPSTSMVVQAMKDTAINWAKKGLQGVVFAQDLVDIAVKEGLTTAKGFFDLLNAKSAKRTHLEALLDRIMTEAADIPDRTAASSFLRDSTRAQAWGYVPSWKSDAQVDPAMEAKYNRLSPEAKTIVDRVFKYGEDNYRELQRLVNKEINDEFDAQLTKAATADERDAIEKERAKRIRTIGRVLPKLQGPYAPLKRFGDYVSVGKSEAYLDAEAMGDTKAIEEMQQDDRHYLVEFHDSFAAAKARARQLQPHFAKTDGFEKQKIYRDVQELPFGAIAKVKQAIADMPEETKHRAALSRLVTDLYLTMLSESSARKSELRRRYVHGEEQDMFRSFASQGRASAHFIAALEKNGEIQKHISKMQAEAAQGPGDRADKNRVFNEILARYAQGLDYRPTPLTDKAMALTSFWMLVSTPSYYLQNATQPFMLTLPVLSGRFGNGAAWAALTKAYKDVFRVYKHFGHDLVVDKLPVSDDEKAMLRQLRDTGRIDLTIAQDLGRWTEGEGVLQKGVVGKVMRKLWAAPHQVEMMNRITSALAAYRLSKGSLEYTARVVDQTHGNYAASNAPRFMHANSAMRLITQFRKFQLIQVSLLGRMLHDAFKNASPEERAVARAALGWVLAHHMVMAGAIGLPLANVAGFVLAAVFGDDDEPKDFERMARKAIGDEDMANLILKGLPAAAGLDVSGRIGMGNAFALLPFTDIKLLDRKGFAETAMSAGGAFLGGILPSMAEGMGQMSKGDYYKGLELLLPRGVRDAMRAYRMATEGISQKNNDVVMKPSELSIFDVMSQAVGLPSTLLQARQRRVGDVIETDQFYKERTGLIKHQYAAAYRENDTEEMQDLREEWAQVAAAMRRQGLKPQPLSNLLRAPREQLKRERETVEGVQTKKSNRVFVRQGAEL